MVRSHRRVVLGAQARAIGVELPDGGFDTLGGFVIDRLGRLAEVGDAVEWDEWVFTVTALDGRRVDRVRITSGDSTSVAGGAPGSSGAGDETD